MQHQPGSLRKMLSFRRSKEKERRKRIISSTKSLPHDTDRRPETAPCSKQTQTSSIRDRPPKCHCPEAAPKSRSSEVPPPARREAAPIHPPVHPAPICMTNSEEDTDSTARLGATPVAPRLARAPKQKRSVPPAQPQSRQEEENEAATIFMAAAALDNAGNDLCDKGEYEGAMTSYTRALQLKQQSLRNVDSDGLLASVATSINNIGYLRQRSGASPEESMLAYRDSLKIKKEILGETHLSVGKTLNNIGSVYYSAHEFEHALQAYHEAKDIMERNLGTTHGDVATVHSNIGDVYMAMGDGQRAHDQYKEALDIRWTCFHGHDPKVIRLLEKIAALEMDQWSVCGHDQGEDDETRDLEDEEEMPDTLHNLSCEVQEDIKEISDLERKMALDMVKDKLRILKGMRNLDIENDAEEVASPRSCTTPLSKSERCEALSSVKERLAKLRERRAMRESTNHETDKEHKYGSLTVCLRECLEK